MLHKFINTWLIPSICGFIDKDCIPCNTSAIIAGENKSFANMIAQSLNFNVPNQTISNSKGIYRPLNYGSSKGIEIVSSNNIPDSDNGIYQEFIDGYDVTIPYLYNPLTDCIESFPAIFYLPIQNTTSWYFDAKSKETDIGFTRIVLPNVSNDLTKQTFELIKKLNIDTYCRIDFRMKTDKVILKDELNNIELNKQNSYFIEINPMPTIEIGNNFHISFENITETNSFYKTRQFYKDKIKNPSPHGFILSCALINKIISKHKKQKDLSYTFQ